MAKYSRGIVNKLTNLKDDSLSQFIEQYPHAYEFIKLPTVTTSTNL